MDSAWQALRSWVEDEICKSLEKKQPNQSSEWKQRFLLDIAKKLEESFFNESINKEDYIIKIKTGIELRIENILNEMRRHQQQTMAHHNLQSNSSTSGMMIPTPVISHNPTESMQMLEMGNNQGIKPTSGIAGIMPIEYQLSHGNIPTNQPGSSSISASIDVRRPVMPQMISTPGFNFTSTSQVSQQQTMPMNSYYYNGSGTLGAYTSMLTPVQPQKQQQYSNLGGQEGLGMQSVPMNQRHSCQVGGGMRNNGLGLLGNNMQQLMNGPAMSEGYIGIGGTYGNSTEPVQQDFSSQQIQQRMPNREDSLQLQIPIPSIFHNPIGTMQMPTMENNQGISPTSGFAGTITNGYQISHGNMPTNQPGSSSGFTSKVIRRQVAPQMKPTPGFNSTSNSQVTQQAMPMNCHYNNGSGTPGADSSMLPFLRPQKQQKYNNTNGQLGPGLQSLPTNQRHSCQGFGDGTTSNGDILSYMNMPINQPRNMSAVVTYGNSRMPVQQGFSTQKIQQKILSLPSQQGISIMGEGTLTEQVDLTRKLHNSAGQSNLSSVRNVDKISSVVASCQSKPKSNMHTNNNQADSWKIQHATQETMPQPIAKFVPFTNMEKVNFQSYAQMSSRQNNHISGRQQQQAMAESLSQHVDFEMPFGNSSGSQGQFLGPLAGSNALNQTVQSDGFSSYKGLVNGQLRGGGGFQQPYSMPVERQNQWRPTQHMQQVQEMQRSNHRIIADNNNVVIEKNQASQNESNQSYMTISSHGVRPPTPKISNTAVVPEKGSSQFSAQKILVKMTLYLIHAESCSVPVGHCPIKNCVPMQQLLKHIPTCYQKQCQVKCCLIAKTACHHFRNCQEINCPVCVEVHNHKSLVMNEQKSLTLNSGSKNDINEMEVDSKMTIVAGLVPLHAPVSSPVSASASAPPAEKYSKQRMNQLDVSSGVFSDQMDIVPGVMNVPKCPHHPLQQPAPKRRKMNMVISPVSVSNKNQSFSVRQEEFPTEQNISSIPAKHELVVKIGPTLQNLQIPSSMSDMSSVQMGYDLERNGRNASEPKETGMEDDGVSGKMGKPKKCTDKLNASSRIFSDKMDAGPGVMDVLKCRNQPHPPLQQPLPKRRRISMDISSVSVNSTNQSLSVEFPTKQSTCNIPVKHELVVKIDPALPNLQIASSMSSVRMGYDLERNHEVELEPKETEREEDVVAGQSGKPKIKGDGVSMIRSFQNDVDPTGPSEITHFVKKQESSLMVQTEDINDENASEAKEMEIKEDGVAGKSEKSKIRGVSLIDFLTPEQVREHQKSIKQWVGQEKAMAKKKQPILNNDNLCQLCGLEKLSFEPPRIFCYLCGAQIKRRTMYYATGTSDEKHICIPCFNETRGETIEVEGEVFPKVGLKKIKNDEAIHEPWVQCDKCQAWLHQICALFNELRNDCDQAECTCPNCYINEVEKGERDPLPQSDMFCAKDLPHTILSDHIENRLVKRLNQERQDRADHSGKSFDEVPGAEGLVVRVVSSVDKKLEVKPRFSEIFQKEKYPTEFPYKSKAILLFQKVEGVEVCIFGMFVQECGTECAFPNQRRVYLSYLDSVKYFRPEIKTVTGESLRTFVYHEILIGYLDYCKRRGFTSCYIWACPPNYKGNDYIFNCHPENQKTPKPVKLREWYRSMLKKAEKENIVVDQTTLHDYFFTKQGESRANVTATRLPYFDGDQLPEVAEGIITELLSPKEDDCMQQKGKMKKAAITKDAGHTDLSDNASMDATLMEKLRKKLYPMREDLIMVHLQHPCRHCRILMVSGTRWVCNTCENFNLCDSCHKADQARETRERHPTQSSETHTLTQVQINNVPVDTNDKDVVIENKSFDTRHTFLALCQGKHYQFGTLRQAKHSSMMMLYHLIVENKD